MVVGEKAPRGTGFVDDVVVAFEHGDGEFVTAQIFPDILDRVQLWSVWRQANERDVGWNGEARCAMITCAIDNEHSMCSRRDAAANFGQMHRHGIGIGSRQDERRGRLALRTDRTKNVGPLVALVTGRTRSRSSSGPNPGQCTLLTNTGFILEPDFDRLAFGMLGKPRRDRGGKVYGMARPSLPVR